MSISYYKVILEQFNTTNKLQDSQMAVRVYSGSTLEL